MTEQNLNERMSFGHVVKSDGAGNVTDTDVPEAIRFGSNEVIYQELDDDGQCIDDELHDVAEGWSALTGFTGQDSYSGPVMHSSEYVGGRMERHIRENAGYYVAVAVDGMGGPGDGEDENTDNIGWAVLFKEVDQ